jgi:hypothetical protein
VKEPTKADLAAAVTKLTEENAGLRDLLAAVSLAADTVPVSKGSDYLAEWKRSTRVLASVKVMSHLDGDWAGELAYAAGHLREVAAEPVGYEVYVETVAAPLADDGDEDGPMDDEAELRRAGAIRDEPASPDAAEALIDAIVAGTPVKAEPYTGHLRTPAIPAGPDDPNRQGLVAGPPYVSEGIDGLRWDNMSSSGGAS